jgi:PIN domain nuclease of toxin-antitoxin system
VILLDTHIWVWWVAEPTRLSAAQTKHIQDNESLGLGVSVISCWEVAKLVEYSKLALATAITPWITGALAYPGVQLLELTPEIVIASTQLPPPFHRDPADQMIVATARVLNIPLLTADGRILNYPHVACLS